MGEGILQHWTVQQLNSDQWKMWTQKKCFEDRVPWISTFDDDQVWEIEKNIEGFGGGRATVDGEDGEDDLQKNVPPMAVDQALCDRFIW